MADSDHDEDAVHSPPAVDQVRQQGWGPVQGLSKHDAHCWNPQQRLPGARQQQLVMHIALHRVALAVLGECHVHCNGNMQCQHAANNSREFSVTQQLSSVKPSRRLHAAAQALTVSD